MKNIGYESNAEDRESLEILKEEIADFENLILIREIAEIISHEIRNPMTTVRGFLQMFMQKPSLAENKEYLKLMIEELDNVNSQISGFLAVNKGEERHFQLCDLNLIIKTIFPLIQAQANKERKNVHIYLHDIPEILVNIEEIRHLILKMCRNSLEAMDRNGILVISTRLEVDKVVLVIQDEGKRIDSDIFKNFSTSFTTKEMGISLDLAVCYRIAKRHGVLIEVNSSQKGAVFIVKFKTPG
jgi:signal transduction histidine kinase